MVETIFKILFRIQLSLPMKTEKLKLVFQKRQLYFHIKRQWSW